MVQPRVRRAERGQSGQSLVELIIVILMLSSVFLMVIGGLFAVNRASETNERIQTVDAALVAYGEILRTQVPYTSCDGGFDGKSVAQQYQTAAETYISGNTGPGAGAVEAWLRPPAMVATVVPDVPIDSWDLAQRDFVTGCVLPDSGIQRISYVVTFREQNEAGDWVDVATRTGQVVKRKAGPS